MSHHVLDDLSKIAGLMKESCPWSAWVASRHRICGTPKWSLVGPTAGTQIGDAAPATGLAAARCHPREELSTVMNDSRGPQRLDESESLIEPTASLSKGLVLSEAGVFLGYGPESCSEDTTTAREPDRSWPPAVPAEQVGASEAAVTSTRSASGSSQSRPRQGHSTVPRASPSCCRGGDPRRRSHPNRMFPAALARINQQARSAKLPHSGTPTQSSCLHPISLPLSGE